MQAVDVPFVLSVFGLSGSDATVLGACVAAVAALALNLVVRRREDRNRRRDLYSEAYRAALEWCEGVYRVRRRSPDGSEDRDLTKHFHELQERIAYYEGWLSIESNPLGTSYMRFLNAVMAQCRPLLQEAWLRPGRPPTEKTPDDEKHPQLDDAKTTFLREVRKHFAAF